MLKSHRKAPHDLDRRRPQIGDRVRLIAETLAWKAEKTLQGKIGEVIERRDDGRVTIRFDNGRLLKGRDAEAFERVLDQGLKAKK